MIKNTVLTSCLQFAGQSLAEIIVLRQILKEKQTQPTIMESRYPRGSSELEDSLVEWRDKYERLLESHKRVEKVNQSLEEKLLGLSDSNVAERGQWTSDVAKLSVSLADANYLISNLRREIVSPLEFTVVTREAST